jgi:transposase
MLPNKPRGVRRVNDRRVLNGIFWVLRSGAPSRLTSKTMLAGRGYDANWIRSLAAEKGAWANIPPRCNRTEPICFSPDLYRARTEIRVSTTE